MHYGFGISIFERDNLLCKMITHYLKYFPNLADGNQIHNPYSKAKNYANMELGSQNQVTQTGNSALRLHFKEMVWKCTFKVPKQS